MDHSAWLIMVTSILLGAIVSFWLDMRKENRRMDSEAQERQREAEQVQQERHVENRERFMRLETSIEPMMKWFNNGRNSGRNQGD